MTGRVTILIAAGGLTPKVVTATINGREVSIETGTPVEVEDAFVSLLENIGVPFSVVEPATVADDATEAAPLADAKAPTKKAKANAEAKTDA